MTTQDSTNKAIPACDLKLGQFSFTPLQCIIINKKMPHGFKLESEENLVKAAESNKPIMQKRKISNKEFSSVNYDENLKETKMKRTKKNEFSEILSHENSNLSNTQKKSLRERRPTYKEDLGYIEKDILKGKANPVRGNVFKKCEKGLQKIKKHQYADVFYNGTSVDAPSLAQIEKNNKNYKYKSLFEFNMDLRKLWSYYFQNFSGTSPEIYQKTCKMSEFSEEVIKELESMPDEKSDISEISKRLDMIAREVKDIKGNQPPLQPVGKKVDKTTSILDKPMSINEKNALGNNIRNLSPDQLKGIVTILSDSMVIDTQSKFFEFDIETLSTRKLRELEKYVKFCLKNKAAKPEPKKKPQVETENEKIQQLKSDLAFTSNQRQVQDSQNAQPPQTSQKLQTQLTPVANNRNNPPMSQPVDLGKKQMGTVNKPIEKKEEVKEQRKVLSDSDSLSSSEESESESLSSLDFKKQPIK